MVYNIDGSKITPNNEKTILAVYIGVENFNKYKAVATMSSVKRAIEQSFNSTEKDDTMVFIYLPSDHWDIKVLSPKNLYLTEEEINKFKDTFNKFIENNE